MILAGVVDKIVGLEVKTVELIPFDASRPFDGPQALVITFRDSNVKISAVISSIQVGHDSGSFKWDQWTAVRIIPYGVPYGNE